MKTTIDLFVTNAILGLFLTAATGGSAIAAGPPSRLVITSTPQILTAGTNSSLITVQLQDALGNPANTTSNRVLTLTSSSAGAGFRNAANATDITTLTIPMGSNSTNYLFRATLAGLTTITNASPGLAVATQTETVIPAAAAKLVVTTQPSNIAKAGIAFPTQPQVTIQDVFGNRVGSFAAAITVIQTSGGNLNGLAVPLGVLPTGGVAIFSGLFMTNTGVSTLTFAAPGVIGTNSTLISAGAGAPLRIRVETLASGAGTVLPAQSLDAGLSATNFAIARDVYGNFVSNTPASWSLVSIDGGVTAGDLVPAGDNKSAVFTGHLRGSANVHATAGVLPVTDSGTLTVVQGTNDPDLPGASARFKVFPAGSLVIAMDNPLQSVVAPFNIKAYGLVNRLLQNYVPVSWAIRSGKPKDGVDFSAPAFRMAPSTTGTSNLNFAGGPFLIHRAYTNLAIPHITAFGNNVAVYQLTADAVVDIRHELRFRPSISVNSVNSSIHTTLLDFAGITNYTVTSDYNLSSNTCFTIFLEPHNGATTGVPSAADFIRSGGNFLAECLAVATYENDPGGHFQSTSNIVTDNIGNTLAYSNPDLPYSQFIGTIDPAPGGSHQDWTMGGGAFKNNAHVHLDDIGASPAHYAGTSSKHSVGPGGLLFYLGGHSYGAGGTDITTINGQRMVLNALFVPSHRPTCGIDYSTDLTITKSDGVHTVTNGQPVTYTIVVANKGFDRVNGARVTDIFGPSLANVSWTGVGVEGATNFIASGTGNLDTTVDLPVYSSVIFTAHATIGYGPECLVTNTATVAAPAGLDDINPEDNIAIDIDHVVPPFIAPPDLLVSCTNLVPVAATNLAAFIAIGGAVGETAVPYTVTYLGDSDNGGAGCPASPLIIARVYRLSTSCADFVDAVQTISVIDDTAPLIQCATNKTTTLGTPWSFDPPMATEGCSTVTISVIGTVTNSLCGTGFTATRTWQATDACGNASVCSQTVTVIDLSAPVIICPPNRIVEAGTIWAFDTPNAGSHLVTILNTITNLGCGNTFSATRTWQAVNDCGIAAQCSQTVTVQDTQPPVITCPSNLVLHADLGQCSRSNVTFVVTATDNGGVTNLVSSPPSGSTFPIGTTTVTNTATDACGNTSTCTFTVTVTDNEHPVITCPTDLVLTADAGHCGRRNVTFVVTATDNCGVTNLVCSPPSGSTFPVGTTTVTNTATDASGNTSTCTFTVTMMDNEHPVITCPTDLVLTADAGHCGRSNVTFVVTATDNCGVTNLVCSPPSGSTFPVGTTTVTSTATDASGNTSTCAFTVTVADNENPVITCPTDLVLTADAGYCGRSNVTFVVTATDNCGVTNLVCSPPSGSTFPIGTTTVTNTATDASGNIAQSTHTITIVDTTAPTISDVADATVECTGSTAPSATGEPTANDTCGSVTVTHSDSVQSDECGNTGSFIRTWTATDASGNTAQSTQTITIVDTTAPTISDVPDATVECTGSTAPSATGQPTASDTCGSVTITHSDSAQSDQCGNTGSFIRTWKATDACGNIAQSTQTITIVDTTPPTISDVPDATVECTGSTAPSATGQPTASDACGSVTITHSDSAQSDQCGNTGSFIRTWTATDACGNIAQSTQTITIVDTTPPTISDVPDAIVECTGSTAPSATGSPTASDTCGSVTITHSDSAQSDECGNTGSFIRTWTATDACGNTAQSTQTITIVDTTAPTVSDVPDAIVECTGSTAPSATGSPTASDTCGSVTITHSDSAQSDECGNTGSFIRTWKATDACGNIAQSTQTITIVDTTPPTVSDVPDVTLECTGSTAPSATGQPTASDTCGSVTITHSDSAQSDECGNTGSFIRTWKATDACGNTAQSTQTITIVDTTPPTISDVPDVTVECAASTDPNATGRPTASDTCGSVTIAHSDSAQSDGCGNTGSFIRTWKATDACGNTAQSTQTITLVDTTAPTISDVPDAIVECSRSTAPSATGSATASDTCGSVTITHSDSAQSDLCGNTGSFIRTWKATDACGNTAQSTQTITIVDTTPPTISDVPDAIVECNGSTAPSATGSATASDTCGSVTITHSDSAQSDQCGNTGSFIRTWTATDACGNTAQSTQTITIVDTTPPTVSDVPDVTLECTGSTAPSATGTATGSDTCGSVTISFADSVTNVCGGAKIIARTWKATDACGNIAKSTQIITVVDTTPPSLQVPANRTLELPANTGTNATGTAAGTDSCGNATISYTDVVTNRCGSTKTIARTWKATDACGNVTSGLQTITLVDTTPPSLQLPANRTLEYPANTGTNATGVATATDASGSPTIAYRDVVSTNCGLTGTIQRLWTATDACGNTTNGLQTITIVDTIPPTISDVPDAFVECNGSTAPSATGSATASDAGGSVTITHSDSAQSDGCGNTGSFIRTWKATDACGNTAQSTQTITIVDTTPPTVSDVPDVTLECTGSTAPSATGTATGSDTCGSVTISFADSVTNVCGGAKIIARTWKATDACGNIAKSTQIITVVDTTPPSLQVPANRTLELPANTGTNATGTATGTDSCGNATISYTDVVTNRCGSTKTIARTWKATDACGNVTSGLQTITLVDTTPPSLQLPANRTLEYPANTGTNATGVATATDASGSPTITYRDVVSTNCGLTVTIQRLWTATDACGNTTNGLQTIAVVDTQPPRITSPTLAVQCAGDVPAAYANLAALLAGGGTATDNSDPTLTFSLISATGLVGSCPGTVTRVYRVTDDCGNFAESIQRITVDDTIAPVLTCPTNAIIECSTSLDPTNAGRATATDNCSTNVSITYTDAEVQSSYSVNFYAADPAANSAPYLPTYLRLGPASLPCPASAALTGRAADPLRNAVAFGPDYSTLDALTSLSGEDMSYGQIVPFEAVITMSGAPGPERGTIEFSAGWSTHTTSNDEFGYDKNYMVYCAFVDTYDPGAIDPNNNARVESFSSVLVNQGTIDEQIKGTFRVSGLDVGDQVVVEIWVVLKATGAAHAGGGIAAQLDSAAKYLNPPVPISIGSKTISISANKVSPLPAPQPQPPLGPPPTPPPPPPGIPGRTLNLIDRTWTATDNCGNQSTCVQRLTVRDSTAPSLTAPANLILEYPADTRTNVTGVAVAQEACGSMIVYYNDVVTNGCGGTKVISRTWTASDDSGNTTNVVQTISVVDTTAPVLLVPANVTLEYPANTATNVTGVATATDASGSPIIICSDVVTNLCGSTRRIARTWTAVDACGNSANGLQTITVVDTKAPALQVPANVTLEYPANTTTNATGVATATDAGGSPIITYSDVVTNLCGSTVRIARTWTAMDACGNSASGLQTITVVDTKAPALQVPANVTLEYPANTTTNATGVATATDAGGSPIITYSDVVTNLCGSTRRIARTWTAVDACGNSASGLQTITVVDTKAPALLVPANVTLEYPANTTTNATGVATATDASGSPIITYSDVVTNLCGSTRRIARTWTAVDACGNSASGLQTINLVDTTAPVFGAMANRTLLLGEPLIFDEPTVTDNSEQPPAVNILSTTTNTFDATVVVTRKWNANDACGNVSSAAQTLTVLTAPTLEILSLDGGKVMLRWPEQPAGFHVERLVNGKGGEWALVSGTPICTGGKNHLEVEANAPMCLYRLSKPIVADRMGEVSFPTISY